MSEKKEVKKEEGVTIQHIGRIRQWTVPANKILKVHRGAVKIDHPTFKNNIVLTPGSIVDAVPELAKMLIKSRDWQKYGVDTK